MSPTPQISSSWASSQAGSGNDFAYAIGLPRDVTQSLNRLVAGNTRLVDLGRINDRFFAYGVGIGLDAQINIESQKIKRLRGVLLYLVALLKVLVFRHRTYDLEINIDGTQHTQQTLLMSVANGRRTAGCVPADPGREGGRWAAQSLYHRAGQQAGYDSLHTARLQRLPHQVERRQDIRRAQGSGQIEQPSGNPCGWRGVRSGREMFRFFANSTQSPGDLLSISKYSDPMARPTRQERATCLELSSMSAVIVIGSAIGLLLGNRLPQKTQETTIYGLGLISLVIGLQMALQTRNILIVMFSILLGGIVGEALGLDDHLKRLGNRIETAIDRRTAARRETTEPVSGRHSHQPRVRNGQSDLLRRPNGLPWGRFRTGCWVIPIC